MADSFPTFYAVEPDDLVVPYPPVKALIEGDKISESEAMRLVNEARAGE